MSEPQKNPADKITEIFTWLKFNTAEKQSYFIEILALAGAFDHPFFAQHRHLLTSTSNIATDFSQRVIEHLNGSELDETYSWLNQVMQEKFFARKGERWETKTPEWIVTNHKRLIELIDRLELGKEILPNCRNYYDAFVILGSTKITMEQRIGWFVELYNKIAHHQHASITKRVFIATGERYVVNDAEGLERDGGEAYLSSIARLFGLDAIEKITEAQIATEIGARLLGPLGFRIFYENNEKWANLDDGRDKEIIVVDTPRPKNKSRPNTEATIVELLKVLEKREWDGVISDNNETSDECYWMFVVSNAPNILAQGVQVEKVLKEYDGKMRDRVRFECGGGSFSINELASSPHQVHLVLMPLAGALYGMKSRIDGEKKLI
jgi:hypothetical protein